MEKINSSASDGQRRRSDVPGHYANVQKVGDPAGG